MEHWKAIAGYEGLYEVSDLGRVRALNYNHTGMTRIMNPWKQRDGYLLVNLHKYGKRKTMLVHRLVASTFIPNPNNIETVNHKDEVKTNNSVDNLEWMTHKDNVTYSQARQVQQLDKSTGELLATFPSAHEAEKITGISRPHICQCCNGRRKSSGGFKWRFA